MMLDDGSPGVHLTYCTNIHRGETWVDTFSALKRHLPEVKSHVSPKRSMGVGLRLSAIAANTLMERGNIEEFRSFLDDNQLYVFTINGFPYGPFHGVRVKEQVYQPDWRTPERLAYSNELADILASLMPSDANVDGSISTVPGTFRPIGAEVGAVDGMVDHLLHHAAHLVRLQDRTGRFIALALEPEPMCFLETTEEAVTFLEQHIFSRAPAARFANLTGLSIAAAETALRKHLGLCLDVCHAAVEFEDVKTSLALVRAAGLTIPKLQLSAALKVPAVGDETIAQLQQFDDGVYLHQVVERNRTGQLRRYLDLAPAFQEIERARGTEWRVHCHVPVFMETLPKLSTTQDVLKEILAMHSASPISRHLEVETYTFDVLPPELRQVDVATAIARELNWVRGQLAQ